MAVQGVPPCILEDAVRHNFKDSMMRDLAGDYFTGSAVAAAMLSIIIVIICLTPAHLDFLAK